MSKPTKITIDSISKNDVRELFNNICDEFIVLPGYLVKKTYLGFNGEKAHLLKQTPSIEDVLILCTKFGIKFSVNVEYNRSVKSNKEVVEDRKTSVPDLNETTTLCDAYNKLEKQKDEITNPELKDLVEAHVPSKIITNEVEKEDVKPFIPQAVLSPVITKIPEFKI